MKSRYIISLTVIIIIFLAWSFLLVRPAIDKGKAVSNSLNESEKQLRDFKNIILQAPEFIKKHKEIAGQKEKMVSQLYTKEDLMALFDDLENKTIKHGLKLIEITPSVEELLRLNRQLPSDDLPQILDIVINLRGRLKNLGQFLQEVESESFYQRLNLCIISNTVEGREYSDITYGVKAVLGTIRN